MRAAGSRWSPASSQSPTRSLDSCGDFHDFYNISTLLRLASERFQRFRRFGILSRVNKDYSLLKEHVINGKGPAWVTVTLERQDKSERVVWHLSAIHPDADKIYFIPPHALLKAAVAKLLGTTTKPIEVNLCVTTGMTWLWREAGGTDVHELTTIDPTAALLCIAAL
ncbi:hypothetical protein OC835_006726 [Tilletia horrida]|nr:hypothetical protein OC835_006726 [Tilletia horrida]